MTTPHHEQAPPPSIVLSDFDYTLCHTYGYDAATNNHLPMVDPELVAAAQPHHLVVATGRRANHPALGVLWTSGLVQPGVPVIAENGGTLVFYDQEQAQPTFMDMVSPDDVAALHATQTTIREHITDIPAGQKLIFKLGRTMLLARIQDENGEVLPRRQEQLVAQLRELLPGLGITDTRVSVTIQHPGITKWGGFLKYLDLVGVNRQQAYVIGMGDGENDKDILTNADFSIGFSSVVRPWVDIEVPNGAAGAPAVLRSIRTARVGSLATAAA